MPIWASVFGGLLGSTTSAASRRTSGYAATTRGSLVIGSLSLFATYPTVVPWVADLHPLHIHHARRCLEHAREFLEAKAGSGCASRHAQGRSSLFGLVLIALTPPTPSQSIRRTLEKQQTSWNSVIAAGAL